MVQSRAAMEDLDEEPVEEDRRGEPPEPPAMVGLMARLLDGSRVQMGVEVLSQGPQHVIKRSMHRGGPRGHGCVITP